MKLYLADEPYRTLTPVPLDVFAETIVGKGKRARTRQVGWQGWNPDSRMESQMARLQGAGSFYWPGAIRAMVAARQILRDDARVSQVKLETISGREIGRLYR